MTNRIRGKVLHWSQHKKHPYHFGHIETHDGLTGGKNVYFKSKEIAPQSPAPFPGAEVEFDLLSREEADGQPSFFAANVQVVSGQQPHEQGVEQSDPVRGIVKFYNDKPGFGFIETEKGDVHVGGLGRNASHSGTPLRGGDLVEVVYVEGEKGKTARVVTRVGYEPDSQWGDPFNDFFEFGSSDWKQKLVQLAEKEPWEFKNGDSHTDFPVLSSYIEHTVRRLQEMDKGLLFSNDGNSLAFNTGLVTDSQEQIFGFVTKSNGEGLRPWVLRKFLREGERAYSDLFGGKKPPLASYWDNPAQLIFDPHLSLEIDTTHILARRDRFPEILRENEHMARSAVIAAKAGAELRAYRNYKVAVPQYFRDKGGKGELQLLLPICLEDPSRADLAITVAKTASNDAYRSATVLTLDQAYNNARLLARPDREWLDPEFDSHLLCEHCPYAGRSVQDRRTD